MKQYHTQIIINAPVNTVWNMLTNFEQYADWNPLVGKLEGNMLVGSTIQTFIIPLGKTFSPVLLSYIPNREIIWEGSQGAKFLLAGKHYYKLERVNPNTTRLLHGEYFTGILSYFIKESLFKKMRDAFTEHNEVLKIRVENGK